MNKKLVYIILAAVILIVTTTPKALAWSNGGYSSDPDKPDYGTHDWIAQHALDWLPTEEKQYILDNLALYLYGTELPDNHLAPDRVNDKHAHHVYYNSIEIMIDDAAAVRAQEEYANAFYHLSIGDAANAAKHAGIMSHYIADVAVFGHVMGAYTEWGSEDEDNHSNYENYVDARTSSYNDEFDSYLSFDGALSLVSAYNATKLLAYDTAFDQDGDLTCVWMDQIYDWSDPTFKDRCGESLNLAVNFLADVLHTLYVEVIPEFPAHLLLPLFLFTTLILALVVRKKRRVPF